MLTRPWVIFLIFAVIFCAFIVGMVLITDDGESTASETNRLCQSHQGVGQDGIKLSYVICRDGFVAKR